MPGKIRNVVLLLLVTLMLGARAYAANAVVTINGVEQAVAGGWDTGTVTVSFADSAGRQYTETAAYGQYSTAASIASTLAAMFSRDYIPFKHLSAQAGSCILPISNVITFHLKGTDTFGPITVSATSYGSTIPSFQAIAPAAPIVTVSCNPSSISVGSSSTCTATVGSGATGIVSFFYNGAALTSSALSSGSASVSLSTLSAGTYNIVANYNGDSNNDTASGSALLTIVDPSENPRGPIYSYTITPTNGASGYAPNGNLLSYTDSVNGTWSFGASGYDSLNRLVSGSATAGPYQGLQINWSYDSFGNRKSETFSGTSSVPLPPSTTALYDDGTNHVTHSSLTGGPLGYDLAGNVQQDNQNKYLYDADGRVCAARDINYGNMTGYVYDAEGNRIAKGTLTSLSCDMTLTNGTPNNGFMLTNTYILGASGEQLTETDGQGNWTHTNVYAAGSLIATYDADSRSGTQPLHFQLADWLGTRRVQTDYAGNIEETCNSLPFGNGLNCPTANLATADDATEHHFTGKERDAESGLDYFGKRYYGSSMGRWMSPDLVNVTEERMMNPSSTLNKYAYAANNPLKYVDPDGQDITYFYDQGGFAGHAVLFAYNQANGDSAIESFGPASKSVGYRIAEPFMPVPGTGMFDMDIPKSADDLRKTYASLTIQTTPELTQQVIDFIRANPDPKLWDVMGPNCSSEVWKILRKFKLDYRGWGANQGMTPKILWSSLYSRYVNNNRTVVPQNGKDYGAPRFDMFDLMWQSLPQSKPHRDCTITVTPNGTSGDC